MRQEDSGYGRVQSVGWLDEEMQKQAIAEYWKLQTTKTMAGNIMGFDAIRLDVVWLLSIILNYRVSLLSNVNTMM